MLVSVVANRDVALRTSLDLPGELIIRASTGPASRNASTAGGGA
jgi:hypothetical protein